MSETVFAIWVIAVLIVLLNGCAAGVVAILHARRATLRRGRRVMTAAAVTALLLASMFIPFALADFSSTGMEEPIVIGLTLAMVFAVSLVVSIPGALIVARKLEAPGEEFRAFE